MTIKDNKSLSNHINYEGVSPEVNLSVSPFGQNRAAEIAYKKAERIVLATHLVTNFVPENENVRENIRVQAQELLAMIMQLREGFQVVGTGGIHSIEAQIRYILSLLDIVHASGHISSMNLEVLKYAYADLSRFIDTSETGSASESLELRESDFVATSAQQEKAHKSTVASKGRSDISIKDKGITDTVKDIETIKDTKGDKSKRQQSLRSKRRASSRRIAILDVITKRSPIHIKDIAEEVSDCSEKTIQRELQSLVHDGVVKKEGSKRWTTYSLVV